MEANASQTVEIAPGKHYELVIDWEAVKNDPQARQRLRTLIDIAVSFGKRHGLIGTGLTSKQVMHAMKEIKMGHYYSSSSGSEIGELKVKEPFQREIRVRLPQEQWEQIEYKARQLRTGRTILARKWILEGLNRHI